MSKILLFFLLSFSIVYAQEIKTDSIAIDNNAQNLKFNYKQLIIPTVFITYGALGFANGQVKQWNDEIQKEVISKNHSTTSLDDFMTFVPAASVYALNIMGIKGKNNLKNETVILVTSFAITTATVLTLKYTTNEERPDGSSNDSFPSGHTAIAFAGAEFLMQEYKDKSIWYGIGGYTIATATGLLRVYNNKHWLSDVVAGAGIGILSTKMAYWINPFINEKILHTKTESNSTTFISPFYTGQEMGVSFVRTF